MSILTRHLIRAHLGPFFFSLSALTGLLFLNAVAQRMEDLAGKGLGLDVLLDFLMLSLPHTIALTMPMAVLVSVLYAFSEMTAANEITAMKAGGVPPRQILIPMLGMGLMAAAVMMFFNDQILPEANHRLKNLVFDIGRKSPTFILDEQSWTKLEVADGTKVFQVMAGIVDNENSEIWDVQIWDRNDSQRPTLFLAERGEMAFNESRTDLYLTLYDGVSLQTDRGQPGGFTRNRFERQFFPLRGVGNEMQRNSASERGDREMPIRDLREAIGERQAQIDGYQAISLERSQDAVRSALGIPVVDSTAQQAIDMVRQRVTNGAPSTNPTDQDQVLRRAQLGGETQWSQIRNTRLQIAAYKAEIHKKYSLSFACIVFVLLGGPLAIRFPRGGLGLVIAASAAIFAVYWVGLITGEDIADKGLAPAWFTMWVPNALFGLLGVWLFSQMGRETSTMRGGGLDELLWTLRDRVTSPFRRKRAV